MRAVIFDMDGVLVDSEAANVALLTEYLMESKLSVPFSVILEYIGAPSELFWNQVERMNPQTDAETAMQGFYAFRRGQRLSYRAMMYPGVAQLLRDLKQEGFCIGLASSTVRNTVLEVLNQCEIQSYFDTLVCGREVIHGKPAPDIFLKAAGLIGAKPEACVVVEDSNRGVRAGKRAGMKVIGKTDLRFGQDISEADVMVSGMEAVTVQLISRLLESRGLE